MLAKELTIGKFTYQISHLDARVGLRAGAKLTNYMAMALADPRAKSPKDLLALLFANPDLGGFLDFLVDTFAPVTVLHWRGDTGAPCQQPLTRVLEGEHFHGNYGDLLAWLAAAVEACLSSFLGGVMAAGTTLQAAVSKSPSPENAPTSG